VVVGLGVAACGVFGTADSETPSEPPPRVDAEAGAQADAASGPDAAPADGSVEAAPPPLCDASLMKTESFDSEADGLIAVDSSQLFGGLPYCNTSVGRCLVRFALSASVRMAMGVGRVVTMNLRLRRADTGPGCNATNDCTGLRESGTITVVPARVDWNEAQMTWTVAQSGTNWAGAGASLPGGDVGGLAGSLVVAATDVTPVVTLDPSAWTSYFTATAKLALRFEVLVDNNRRQFVSVTHELGATPHEPPKLTVSYCP
jgi:hypothetical protein